MSAAKTPECRKCGTIGKSGKSSCCGRGGSWFRNCGNAGNVKNSHTWYEGIQVCNTRSQPKRASGRESNAAQQQLISSNRADRGDNTSMTNTSTITTMFTISHTNTLTTTTSDTITATISTSTMITQTFVSTDWISQGMYV